MLATAYPEHKPVKHGYYVTKYWNVEREELMLKAFWWNGIEWGGWRLPIEQHVVEFYAETHALYYVPSMMKAGL